MNTELMISNSFVVVANASVAMRPSVASSLVEGRRCQPAACHLSIGSDFSGARGSRCLLGSGHYRFLLSLTSLMKKGCSVMGGVGSMIKLTGDFTANDKKSELTHD